MGAGGLAVEGTFERQEHRLAPPHIRHRGDGCGENLLDSAAAVLATGRTVLCDRHSLETVAAGAAQIPLQPSLHLREPAETAPAKHA